RTEMVEAVRAISGAVAALADTLNALGLRIALEKTAHDSSDDHYSAYYHRLALLAESAAGQLGGIQKLLSVIELITVRSEPEQIKTPSGL
ncbi:MAG TPA: hypothetical protein VJN94_06655, partial [Candidatus Binataceae bacterium]|nr:hypothetical protein [Candidatus Binataceae bacterium]